MVGGRRGGKLDVNGGLVWLSEGFCGEGEGGKEGGRGGVTVHSGFCFFLPLLPFNVLCLLALFSPVLTHVLLGYQKLW